MEYLLYICIFVLCVLKTSGYEQCHANPIIVNPRAEARFSVILSIRQSTGVRECGEISQDALQIVSSIQWAVGKLNAANFVPGISIGFDVYDDCGLDRYSAYHALDAVSDTFPNFLRTCTGNTTRLYLGILGASRSQTTYTVLSMLNGTNIPVISPFASLPSLREFPNFMRTTPVDTQQVKTIVDLMEELGWTYVAVIHTDDNYGKDGIANIQKLTKERGICIDTVITLPITLSKDDSETLESVITALEKQKQMSKDGQLGVIYFGQKNIIEQILIKATYKSRFDPEFRKIHWIMSDFVGTSTEVFTEAGDFANGSLTISTSAVVFEEARGYFLNKWNTVEDNTNQDPVKMLLKEYKNQPQIGSSGTVTADSWRSDLTTELMDAIFVMASALNDTFVAKCQKYTSICEGFENFFHANILTYMKNVQLHYSNLPDAAGPQELISTGKIVQFDEHGDLVPSNSTPLYNINEYVYDSDKNLGKFLVVGSFMDNKLYLNKSLVKSSYQQSACSSICPGCSNMPAIPYEYLPGDVLILGIFSLHQSLQDPFKCGNMRTFTFDVISFQAFLYAVKQARNTTGINFGAVVFDDCYSAAKINLILTQFLSNSTQFTDNDFTQLINPEKVVAIIGPSPSGVAVPANFLSTSLSLPSISYSASSPDLDDRINFPYFSRTVPSDVEQAQAMIKIIKFMGWKYVGLVYVKNNYGSKGKEIFLQKANENGICVEEPIVLSETSENSQELNEISINIQKRQFEVVVYFGTQDRIRDLLIKMKSRVDAGTMYDFIFLASEDWGDNREILNKAGSVARGSITFKIDTGTFRTVSQPFLDYLKTLSPNVKPHNSWFREFWRDYFNCDPDGGFDQSKGTPCPEDQHFTEPNLTEFRNDQRILQTMNSVYAAALGLKHAKDVLCKFETGFPCNRMKTNPEDVVKAIRNISLLSDDSRPVRVFDDNGNGNVGFTILNVQEMSSGYYLYKEVGRYKGNELVLNKNDLRFYGADGKFKIITAQCVGTCTKCRLQNTTTQAPVTASTEMLRVTETFRLPDILILVVLGSLVLILFIALIVVTCYFRGKLSDLDRSIVYNRPSMLPASYYNEDRRPAVEKFKHLDFHPREIKFVNQQPGSDTDNTVPVVRGQLQNYQELNNDQTSPKNGVGRDNLGFTAESYLNIIDDMANNNNHHQHHHSHDSADVQEQNHPQNSDRNTSNGAIPKRRTVSESKPYHSNPNGNIHNLSPAINQTNDHSPSRPDLQFANFRPELPPRDHPSPTSHTNNSSLDSTGHITPNGYPRMGTSPLLQNGYLASTSGHQSPVGLPRMGNRGQSPTSVSPVSPVAVDGQKILGTFSSASKTPQPKIKRLPSQNERKVMLQNAHSMERISRV